MIGSPERRTKVCRESERRERRVRRRGDVRRPVVDGPPRVRLAQPEVVPLGAIEAGAVVFAHVPFDDGVGWKLRPAVVVGRRGRTVELLPIRSSDLARKSGGRPIEDWEAAGLTRPSVVFMATVEVDRIDVIDLVGQLTDADQMALLGERRMTPL